MIKEKLLAGILSVVLLAGASDMGAVYAANGAGEVSSIEIDGFMLDDYTTTYVGDDKNVSGKKIQWVNLKNAAGVSYGYRSYKYDSKKRVVKVVDHRNDGVTPDTETVFLYDKNANLKKITKTCAGEIVNQTVRDIDTDGYLTGENYYNKNGEYGYSKFTFKDNRIIKQLRMSYANGNKKDRIRYKYNFNDNITSVSGGGCNCKFVYDSDERLIRARVNIDGIRQKYKCTYDGDGYLSRMTVDNGVAQYTEVFHYKTKK